MRYKFKLAFILGRDPISFALTNSMAQVGKPSHAKNRTTVLFGVTMLATMACITRRVTT